LESGLLIILKDAPDMSKLKANLSYNLVNQLLMIALPLFLNIYLVRVLDLEDLGKWYLVNSAAALVQLLITTPHFWLVKMLSGGAVDPRKTVAAGIITYLSLLLGAAPFYVAYIVWAAPDTSFVAMMVFAHLLISTVACEYYFQAFLKQRFLMIRRIATRSILLVLLVVFVRDTVDFKIFLFLTIGTYIIEHIIGLVTIIREIGLTSPDRETLLPTLGSVREMLPFNATHNTLPHIVLLLSPRIFDLETIAILSILIRIVNMTTTLVTSSTNVIFPYLASGSGDHLLKRRLIWLTGLVATGLATLCFIFSKPISWIFLNRSLEPEQVLGFGILCTYIVIHSLYNYIAFNFLVARSLTKYVTRCNILILMSFAALTSLLPSTFATYAVAMTLCAGLGLAVLWFVERKTRKNHP
jgi:O-antigen/teichoic acid export membrane protein